MVIIDNLDLEVKVLINGAQTAEYPDNDFDEADVAFGVETASYYRYIESVDNAEFAIELDTEAVDPWLDDPGNVIVCAVNIDGQEVEDVALVHKGARYHVVDGVKDYKNDTVTVQKFRFSPICVVEDAKLARIDADEKRAEHLGVIQVRAYRGTKGAAWSDEKKGKEEVAREVYEGNVSLAAKALKGSALSHTTVFSPAVTSEGDKFFDYDLQDTWLEPFAVVYFKYRSKAALQQELIIPGPRTLTSPPLERGMSPRSEDCQMVDGILENLPLNEIRRLARQRKSGSSTSLDTLSFTEVCRLANETLDSLPFREVRHLIQQNPSVNSQPASVKREADGDLKSDRAFKYVKIEEGKEAIDLTDE